MGLFGQHTHAQSIQLGSTTALVEVKFNSFTLAAVSYDIAKELLVLSISALSRSTLSSPVDFNYDNALKISSVLSRGFSSRSVASLSFAHVSASRNVLHLHLDLLRILVRECRSPLEKKDVARFLYLLLAP